MQELKLDCGRIVGYLTIKEACAKAGVTESTMKRWIDIGSIPHINLYGKPILIKDTFHVPTYEERRRAKLRYLYGSGNIRRAEDFDWDE